MYSIGFLKRNKNDDEAEIKMKRLRRWSNKPKATQLLCCVRRNARCLFYEKFHTAHEVFLIVILMMFPVMLIWYFFSSRICVCGLCGEKIITINILSIPLFQRWGMWCLFINALIRFVTLLLWFKNKFFMHLKLYLRLKDLLKGMLWQV